MAFQVSPGVNVSEIDLTAIVPTASTTAGALAGVFRWGPIGQLTLVDSEDTLWKRFGQPTNLNAETFFTGANFLSYGNQLYVSRAGNTNDTSANGVWSGIADSSGNIANAVANGTYSGANVNTTFMIINQDDYYNTANIINGVATGFSTNTSYNFIAKYPGAMGSSLAVSLVDTAAGYSSNIANVVGTTLTFNSNSALLYFIDSSSVVTPSSNIANLSVSTAYNSIIVEDYITVGNSTIGTQNLQVTSKNYINGTAGPFTTATAGWSSGNSTLTFTVINSQNPSINKITAGMQAFILGGHGFSGIPVTITTLGTDTNGNIIATVNTIPTAFSGVSNSSITGNSTSGSNTITVGTTAAATIAIGANISCSNTSVFTGNASVLSTNQSAGTITINTAASATNTNATYTVSRTTANLVIYSPLSLTFNTPYTLSTSNWSPATPSQANTTGANVGRLWQYFGSVPYPPSTSQYVSKYGNSAAVDQVHVVVTDALGAITGTPGQILETYQGLSRAYDAQTTDGSTNFYVNVLNQNSNYVWFANHRQSSGYVANAAQIASVTNTTSFSVQFAGGQDGFNESTPVIGTITNAYDLFKSKETAPISLLMTGKSDDVNTTLLANYLIQNIAQPRMDCVVFVSPNRGTVVNNLGNEATSIVSFRQGLTSTSYGVLDSGYKYQYDKYNDIYRYIPLNGDIAGLCVYTDTTRDPWWSPAGFNRGQIKNVVKLAFNPSQAYRDYLYPNGVNPVVTFPGQGTVLFGDKTLQAYASAFDRINVRRLFIVLEKTISIAAQNLLFEFNDAFTRAQFVSLVTPFLKDVQGRRGIYDFQVICDTTNNTPEVIDSNTFVGDIYIKPARSINYIQLNFVAVRTGVAFSEIVGQF